MSGSKKPRAIMLAGINGAGKTNASRALLADTLKVMPFVNADAIAQGINGFDPESAAFEAGRIMVERLRKLVDQRTDFALETTLAARTYAKWVREITAAGYTTHLYYFWLDSADLAVSRVAMRVSTGGHHIPEPTIRQRYGRSLQNLFTLYIPVVTTWKVYDNTTAIYRLIAEGGQGYEPFVYDDSTWQKIQQGAGS